MCIEKNKLVWFWAMEGSKVKFCQDQKLDWGTEQFNILGINFTANLERMWTLNTDNKMLEIQRLLTKWKRRDLTFLGKITIIKSLGLSKLVHLFLALPNPPQKFIKDLTKMFYDFIWNGGPDRVKREVLTKGYNAGGAKMIDIEQFINALKLSWLRRFFTKNNTWQQPLNLLVEQFPLMWKVGSQYMINRVKTDNPFWSDILEIWDAFCSKIYLSKDDILNEPLWFNVQFNDTNLCIYNWFMHGIRTLSDIVDDNGTPLNFFILKERYNIKGTILDYQRVLSSIPKEWLQRVKNNNVVKFTPGRNRALTILLSSQKGCKFLYTVLVSSQCLVPSQGRWHEELEDYNHGAIPPIMWKDLYKIPWKCTSSSKLQALQYKINHRFVATNRVLFHMNIKEDDLCSFCRMSRETILHLFIECHHSKALWNAIQYWLTTHLGTNITFSIIDILFGRVGPNNLLINHLLLITKQYIFSKRFNNGNLHLEGILATFEDTFKIEQYSAKVNMKTDTFFRKWAPLYNLFNV